MKGRALNTYWLLIRGLRAWDLNTAVALLVKLQWSGLLQSALESQSQKNKHQEQVQPFLPGNMRVEEVSVGMQKVVICTKFLMLLKECTWTASWRMNIDSPAEWSKGKLSSAKEAVLGKKKKKKKKV